MTSRVASTTTLPRALRDRAAAVPDGVAIIDAATDREVTFAEFDGRVHTWARRLAAHGVGDGDLVMTQLGPTFEAYYVWLGLSGVGAAEVPLNSQLKGRTLTYLINHSESRLLITQAKYLDNVLEIADTLEFLECVVVLDLAEDGGRSVGRIRVMSGAEFALRETPVVFRYAERHQTSCVIYTSGTTGPPKGVIIPWGWLATSVDRVPAYVRGGNRYSFLSPAHMSGKVALDNALVEGRILVLRENFSVSAFWDDIRRYNCDVTQLFPAMIQYLLEQPPTPEDRDVPLKYFWTAPVTKATVEFMKRFDLVVSTGYGMTEIGGPIWGGEIDGSNLEACGTLNASDPRGFELRLVDENDYEVERGEVGELIVRTTVPWSLNAGYFRNPEATAAAWRNGWFHTGDAMRQDSEGRYYFVDRFKDCIRRRGENVSSFEVEAYALDAAGVTEAAAIGVPSSDGEEDVKIFLVGEPGVTLDLSEIGAYLARSMPRFMVPRFLEQVDRLPRTPTTGRVQKGALRARTPGEHTWDRAATL